MDSRLDYRMKISVERDVTDNLHPPVVVQILLDPQLGEVSILISLVIDGFARSQCHLW